MKRIVEVSTPGSHLHLRLGSLVISRDREEVASVPLEDLGTLILASPALTLSSALLAQLAGHGGVTVACGKDFQPEGALLPLRAHSTRGERIRAQISARRPLEKQLWASLIRAKIRNQAELIQDERTRRRLVRLSEQVRSGDPNNREAQAARTYWPSVFYENSQLFRTTPFRRGHAGAWPNNLLNYGYAILRAVTARAICGAGLLPEVGIHHHNRYDPFALASDLMEPFRPWVDRRCQDLVSEGALEVDAGAKRALLGIYESSVEMSGTRTPLLVALQRSAASLAGAFLSATSGNTASKAAALLVVPKIPAA